MIWIVGGTSEARELVDRVKDLDIIVTTATKEGSDFLDIDEKLYGRLAYEEMEELVADRSIRAIVDMTHPYALLVTENLKKLARERGLVYLRYARDKTEKLEGVIYLKSYEEAYDYLAKLKGKTVFFTTGSKFMEDFESLRADNRFIYRILPLTESIEKARDLNIDMRDIVAILGPVSYQLNRAMFKEYQIDYMIMKDSGKRGLARERIEAALDLGAIPIVIAREEEEGYHSLEELERKIREVGKNGKFI